MSNSLEGERLVAFLVITAVIGVAFTIFAFVTFYIAHKSEERLKRQ